MGNQLGLRDKNKFALLWIVDFPMFEWSEQENRLMAMHHPFTHPKDEDIDLLDTDPAAVRADAYDMVINGVEVGGGSIRIHDPKLQAKMFEILGFTPEKAEEQFGFLMNAFKYGAPPHGGLAYGLDRWVSLFAGLDSIRDCIAFPKNNSGRDVMLDAPAALDPSQLDELNLIVDIKEVKRPDKDAQLVAENIALQLENRISFRRAMKSTMQRTMKAGAKGIKTSVSGRLGGADMALSLIHI